MCWRAAAQLDVSAPVTAIVPELAGTSFDGATVQHLLDMRAGTAFNEEYADPEADVRTYERVYLWRPPDGRPCRRTPSPTSPRCATTARTAARSGTARS